MLEDTIFLYSKKAMYNRPERFCCVPLIPAFCSVHTQRPTTTETISGFTTARRSTSATLQYRSFRHILGTVYTRYRRPLFVAETGVEADRRPAWLAYIGAEARAAMRAGGPLAGLCWYPL